MTQASRWWQPTDILATPEAAVAMVWMSESSASSLLGLKQTMLPDAPGNRSVYTPSSQVNTQGHGHIAPRLHNRLVTRPYKWDSGTGMTH